MNSFKILAVGIHFPFIVVRMVISLYTALENLTIAFEKEIKLILHVAISRQRRQCMFGVFSRDDPGNILVHASFT